MSWRLAKSLETLRNQVNAAYPNRNKASDGTIGDAAHQAVASDHNPNAQGVVTALDITHSPETGFDVHALADRLLANRHPNLKYLISNRRIAGDWTGWRWVPYSGTSDPHTNHAHISVGRGNDGQSQPPYDDTNEWAVNGATPAPTPQPKAQAQTVTLPAAAGPWRAYKVGSGYRPNTSDQVGILRPDLFGGLTYPIEENRGNVVVITTQDYGRVAIWVQGTSAIFGGGQAPAVPTYGGSTVTFPASAGPWRVYTVGSGYRPDTSDQKGRLRPDLLGDLTYPIEQRLGNVVVITTRDFGRVAAWVQGTPAIIR